MTAAAIPALFVAGVIGGIVSVLVSLVSLVTYPALLAVGLSPLAANVTNTVSLTFTGIGAGLSSRRELRPAPMPVDVRETVLVTLAASGDNPTARSAGYVTSDTRLTRTLTIPPITPATNSAGIAAAVMCDPQAPSCRCRCQ